MVAVRPVLQTTRRRTTRQVGGPRLAGGDHFTRDGVLKRRSIATAGGVITGWSLGPCPPGRVARSLDAIPLGGGHGRSPCAVPRPIGMHSGVTKPCPTRMHALES